MSSWVRTQSQPVDHGQANKSAHGDLAVWPTIKISVKGHAKCHIIAGIGQMHELTSKHNNISSGFVFISIRLLKGHTTG